eukprot:scpid9692/ scgid31458/ 
MTSFCVTVRIGWVYYTVAQTKLACGNAVVMSIYLLMPEVCWSRFYVRINAEVCSSDYMHCIVLISIQVGSRNMDKQWASFGHSTANLITVQFYSNMKSQGEVHH